MGSTLRADLIESLAAAGDPERAVGQQRYMKSDLPFHGVRMPEARRIAVATFAEHPLADSDAWQDAVLGLWRSATHREQRYAAIELVDAARYRDWLEPQRLPMVEEMIVTGAWWDYVDRLATHPMGRLLQTYPAEVRPVMVAWSHDPDVWRRRTSILVQLRFRSDTDTDLLFGAIEASLGDEDFFARKAIGWALREYSKTAPELIEQYVAANQHRLSELSRREALKVVERRRARREPAAGEHQRS